MSSTSRMICVRGWRCPSGGAFPGQRHVEALGRVEPLGPLEGGVTVFDGSLEALAHGVERHARLAVTHLPQRELQLALPAEEADAQVVELVERRRRLDRAQSLVLERLGVHPPTVPSAFVTSPYDPFAAVYDTWAAEMTEDVPFYVELAREAEGPVVELAVGNGRVAVPVALETGRRVIGVDLSAAMLAQAKVRAEQTGAELELHEGDMRDFELDEPAALVYCPFRALLHLPTWHDKRRVFERVAASLQPGGRFAWNVFCFNHHIAARLDGTMQRGPAPPHAPLRAGRQPRRHRARRRRRDLALVGDEVRVGRPDRRRRPRGGGALRLVRQAAVRRREPGVRVGDAEAGLASAYDAIARLYDPWSRSVVEDVAFYVEEASRAAPGPVVELGVGTGRIAVPVAAAGISVIGVDSSAGMLDICREAGELAGVSEQLELRLGDYSRPPVAERVSLVLCPFRAYLHLHTEAERLEALRAAHDLLVPGGRLVFDVFTPSAEDIEETHGRWLEREPGIFERADWDTHAPRAHAVAARPGRRDDDGARLGLPGRMARRCCTRPGSRSTPATAGSTAGHGRARRTRFGSRPVLF